MRQVFLLIFLLNSFIAFCQEDEHAVPDDVKYFFDWTVEDVKDELILSEDTRDRLVYVIINETNGKPSARYTFDKKTDKMVKYEIISYNIDPGVIEFTKKVLTVSINRIDSLAVNSRGIAIEFNYIEDEKELAMIITEPDK